MLVRLQNETALLELFTEMVLVLLPSSASVASVDWVRDMVVLEVNRKRIASLNAGHLQLSKQA